MSFTLHSAIPQDAPVLAAITHDAPQRDAHTQLKVDYGDYNHGATMETALSMWLARPPNRCRVVKAIDDESGEVLGWVVWGFRGYGGDPPGEPLRTSTAANNDKPPDASEPLEGISRLGRLTDTNLQEWMVKLMPEGTKCMFIHSIVVVPAHQGRCVGTALLQYGTSQADRDGVFIWVHSSEAGVGRFAKAGFKEIGGLTVDLDEAAREEEEIKAKDGMPVKEAKPYGTYMFLCMKRLPVSD